MLHQYDFAPLDGLTRAVYRRVWRERFGGADRMFLPFFSPTSHHLLTNKDLSELSPAMNAAVTAAPDPWTGRRTVVVPQVMTRRAEDLIWAAKAAAELGYGELNLNLGCPSGTVTGKGKGAGFLLEPEELDRFFDAACPRLCLPLSVKTRVGFHTADEFPRLLDIFNRYPLASLILHARTAKEKYRGPVHTDAWEYALSHSRNPVSCNGNLRTVEEIADFSRQFPAAGTVMLGRGALADPALFRKLRGGPAASREELRSFTAALYRAYQRHYGEPGHAAQRMREVWFYLIHLFEDDGRCGKRMRRFRGAAEYEAAEAEIFTRLPLRQASEGELI